MVLLQMQCDGENAAEGELPGERCEKCKNKGYIAIVQYGATAAVECECMSQRKLNSRIKTSGLERLIKTKTFDAYQANTSWQKQAKQLTIEFAQSEGNEWLYMGGQPGSGKTHLCVAASAELLKRHKLLYCLWTEQSRSIIAKSSNDSYFERERITDALKQTEILYIDDFMRRKAPSQAEIDLAFEIINSRYNNGLRTIITSERTISELINGDETEAIGSRIMEMCGRYCVTTPKDKAKNMRIGKG